MTPILEVHHLAISYGRTPIIRDLDMTIQPGRLVMLAGESGSGKSTFIKCLPGLLGPGGRVTGGTLLFQGSPLPLDDQAKLRAIRGKEISIILQNPDLFLDPLLSIGYQYWEGLKVHRPVERAEADRQAIEVLKRLSFQHPEQVLKAKPFELSGGMCQRAAIAIAMANNPPLLLADEPTSALDVASQEDVMTLLKSIQNRNNTTILLVTHNMSIVRRYADEVGILYRGALVEWGCRDEIIKDARHPYTQMLLASVPNLNGLRCPVPQQERCFEIDPATRTQVSPTHWFLSRREDEENG